MSRGGELVCVETLSLFVVAAAAAAGGERRLCGRRHTKHHMALLRAIARRIILFFPEGVTFRRLIPALSRRDRAFGFPPTRGDDSAQGGFVRHTSRNAYMYCGALPFGIPPVAPPHSRFADRPPMSSSLSLVSQGFTVPVPVYPAKFPKWRAVAMNMVPGVGILTFPSKAEMRSTFMTSDSPAEVSFSGGVGG